MRGRGVCRAQCGILFRPDRTDRGGNGDIPQGHAAAGGPGAGPGIRKTPDGDGGHADRRGSADFRRERDRNRIPDGNRKRPDLYHRVRNGRFQPEHAKHNALFLAEASGEIRQQPVLQPVLSFLRDVRGGVSEQRHGYTGQQPDDGCDADCCRRAGPWMRRLDYPEEEGQADLDVADPAGTRGSCRGCDPADIRQFRPEPADDNLRGESAAARGRNGNPVHRNQRRGARNRHPPVRYGRRADQFPVQSGFMVHGG